MIKMCSFYKSSRKCINKDYCIEQLPSDENCCTSNLYYCMDLEQQNKQMREALEKAKKMFIEQGHCPWADGTGKFDCESCNDNCMFPSIQQALNQLKGVE